MKLRSGRYGPFFGCTRFPECKGLQPATADGRPIGTPATRATRALRAQVITALKSGDLDSACLRKPVSEMGAEDCEAALREAVPDPDPCLSVWELVQMNELWP